LAERYPTKFRAHEPLVLFGTEVQRDATNLPFVPPSLSMYAVAHQTAGMACHHRYFVGLPLVLSDAGLRIALQVASFCERSGHDCVGLGGLHLSDLAAYHAHVAAVGGSCELLYNLLEEGCYPLDPHCASLFTAGTFPPLELFGPPVDASLSAKEQVLHRLSRMRSSNRWGVFVLADNCD